MKRLAGVGEIVGETAQRLIRWGATEGQAHALSGSVSLTRESTDDECVEAVCLALVRAKQAVGGEAEIEYVNGQRRDTLRLEGQ